MQEEIVQQFISINENLIDSFKACSSTLSNVMTLFDYLLFLSFDALPEISTFKLFLKKIFFNN